MYISTGDYGVLWGRRDLTCVYKRVSLYWISQYGIGQKMSALEEMSALAKTRPAGWKMAIEEYCQQNLVGDEFIDPITREELDPANPIVQVKPSGYCFEVPTLMQSFRANKKTLDPTNMQDIRRSAKLLKIKARPFHNKRAENKFSVRYKPTLDWWPYNFDVDFPQTWIATDANEADDSDEVNFCPGDRVIIEPGGYKEGRETREYGWAVGTIERTQKTGLIDLDGLGF